MFLVKARLCIIEWLNRSLTNTEPGRCAYCQRPDEDDHVVIPFGLHEDGQTWLHPDCWPEWHALRRDQAEQELAAFGISRSKPNLNGKD